MNTTQGALQDLAPGSLFGPYRIVRLLGKGGMGAVYEAEHRTDGRVVALKLLSVDLDAMDSRERFLREGQVAAAINHPNAVYIYGTEEIDGIPAISMELVPGGTLDQLVKERGALPWTEAVDLILQVIDGLDAALAAGVLHRDVKPANCFIGSDGVVKIGDFGLSKPVDGEEQQKLTRTGLFLGTPVYSAPEQLLGEPLDVRADIYAVGVTFYHLLTGRLPYVSGSMMQTVAAVLNGDPAPLAAAAPGVPPSVIDVVMKSMARKPADRYQNYEEFRDAVQSLRAVEHPPASLWDRFRASIVDWLVNAMLAWAVMWLLLGGVTPDMMQDVRIASVRQFAVGVVLALLVVGIPEGLRGASIGKWLVGIRVVGPGGTRPGIPRAFARVLLLLSADLATIGLQWTVDDQETMAALTLVATFGLRGVFLVTARRHNGWRLLHDVITGTRVVRSRAALVLRRGETQRLQPPTITGSERRLGPYAVLGPLHASTDVLRGWDPALRRAVWIVPRAPNAQELPPVRRSLSRLTRLRWVGSHRAQEDSWDAFEAPAGELLAERITRPVPWSTQRAWLDDAASELLAARQDGSMHGAWNADTLWVTPADRLVFPESTTPIGAKSDVTSDASGTRVLTELVTRIRSAPRANTPLPRHATRALEMATAARTPEEVLAIVRDGVDRPLEMSRTRRAGLMAATAGPLVLLTLGGSFSSRQATKLDDQGYLMAGLISYVNDSNPSHADSVRRANATSTKGTARVLAALEEMRIVVRNGTDTTSPPDTLRRRRKLAEAYLVTSLRGRMIDTVSPAVFGNTPKEQRRRKLILARNPSVDSATAREARVLVDSVWKRAVPGDTAAVISRFIPFAIAGSVLLLGAVISIMGGLLARRGLLLRGFQVDLVRSDGAPAGRLRVLARNLAIWNAALLACTLVTVAPMVSIGTLVWLMIGAAIVSLLLVIAGIVTGLRTPSRGLAERVTGTWLVPE